MIPLAFIAVLLSMPSPASTLEADSVKAVDAHTVTVFADPCAEACFTGVPSTSTLTVDELMSNGSAMLIRRAAIAGEAMVGGLRGAQVALTIDGMKIHSACIDKMDPATAYVELDNLQTLELTSGSGDLRYGSNLGGALSFQLRHPSATAPLAARVSILFDANSLGRTVKTSAEGSVDSIGIRAAYTYRAANDFRAGGDLTIAGSNYAKHNAAIGASWLVAPQHTLELTGIYDLATFIGYPALLMDTRRAEAVIAGLDWISNWGSALTSSVKVYANTVDHVMDDLDRSEQEVTDRDFMSGMYMPMMGTSFTVGLLSELRWSSATSVVSAVLDLSHLTANATMDMLPIDSTVAPMMMTNVGDARIGTYGLNVVWDHALADDLTVRSSGRADVSPRTLQDQASREILAAYAPNAPIDRTLTALSATVGLRKALSGDLAATLTLSTLERLPTHLESYGFWLYDPQANMVTVGNPGLHSERSWGVEFGVEHRSSTLQLLASARSQWITDYIATTAVESNELVPLRYYSNVGLAMLATVDLSCNVPVSESVVLGGMATFTYGEAIDVGDPLPMISPAQGLIRCIWTVGEVQVEGRLRGAIAQYRTSATLLPENATNAWFTADVSGQWSVSRSIVLMATIRNLFDALYHDHTSINDLPSPGRALLLEVRTSW